ncbi:MAG TPA: non-ribosomal peptide synthase [Herpetosiphon sp.]|uniref:Amino acid adenylation domain n=1 Tax=Herpetosiphon aurantiacus (strain ATCC 23779 / DSM 785 / 114-95) TaxID=316274 RepID=A9AW82_HERA2|nr:non-ribosomal peptide synthetase [Herpetosiphon sp.]ABX04732.1 amino acid adenylation domain [Herpetosiphon aurantiacus DSM 785]HBW49953.1 non-ribosomal peptide synthase [Herpetosiphon sp.]
MPTVLEPITPDALSETLRQYLQAYLPDYMLPAAFVPLEQIPRLPNGKIDRAALPMVDFAAQHEQQTQTAPRNPLEQQLAAIWQQTLQVPSVGIHDNFFQLGGDSILSIQVIARANRAGIRLTTRQLFEQPTIAQLASLAQTTTIDVAHSELSAGQIVPLTPIQRWLLADPTDPSQFNQALFLQFTQAIDSNLVASAVEHVAQLHVSLRLRYRRTADGWQQFVAAADAPLVEFEQINAQNLNPTELAELFEATTERLQRPFDLAKAALWRIAYIAMPDAQPARLLLVMHHLVVDGVSWRIIIQDLAHALQNQPLTKPAVGFAQWAIALERYAHRTELQQQRAYWLAQTSTDPLPVDDITGHNDYASVATITKQLSQAHTTALIHQASQAYQTQINELLLAALTQTITAWSGHADVVLQLEGHGREELDQPLDLSQTVGWFTTLFPIKLSLPQKLGSKNLIKQIKEQIRAVPQRGFGYGLLRSADAALQAMPTPAISFNYFGQLDQTLQSSKLFSAAPESTGSAVLPQRRREQLLAINCQVLAGQLQIEWSYSQHLHSAATIERLAEAYCADLVGLIEHCCQQTQPSFTPADFPLAQITQAQLDQIEQIYPPFEQLYPLSSLQQGILFHRLYAPDAGDYITQMQFEITGQLNHAAFSAAWNRTIGHYRMLRTAFVWQDLAEPLQLVLRQAVITIDFQQLPMNSLEQEQVLEAYLQADRTRGFEPTQAPLMRVALFERAPQRYCCIWTNHHLIIDGWSLPLILDSLFRYYQAEINQQPLELAPEIPYQRYIQWLAQHNDQQATAFWRELLRGFTAPTSLALERFGSTHAERHYSASWLQLDSAITQQLQQFARDHGLTVNSLLQAAWALVLSRYSHQTDIVFGTTTAGRPTDLAGVEQIVGMFVNTLPTRVKWDLQQPVLDWLQALQAQESAVRSYEASSLIEIQACSELPRNSPLFESILVFENYPVSSSDLTGLGDLELRLVPSREQTNYPLTLVAVPGDGLAFKLMYQQGYIDQLTSQRMLDYLQQGLAAMLAQPKARLGQLNIGHPSEIQALADWNATAAPRQTSSLLECFYQQVAAQPTSIAVAWREQRWSYFDLAQASQAIAGYLRDQGVQRQQIIGLRAERNPQFVAALLAILQLGAVYLPIDPQHPVQRQQQLAQHVDWLLTDALAEAQPQQLDLAQALGYDQPASDFVQLHDRDLAYVLFTSGSTGTPKGVMIDHAGMLNHIDVMIERLALTQTDCIAQSAAQSFDISVWQLLTALVVGARMQIIDDQTMRDPQALLAKLAAANVSIFEPVPSLIQALLETIASLEQTPSLAALRWVLPTGEHLPRELAQQWFAHYPYIPLLNAYGPAECADDVTLWPIASAVELPQNAIPIGRPVANVRAYVLDASLRPVPIGVAGELYIAGIAVGWGYLADPQRTASLFLPDPWGEPGARMYRTGDLARYNQAGVLSFLGRSDQQVKIRGFRIELGEIEACLLQHPALHSVAVAVVGVAEQARLIAYLVAKAKPVSDQLLRDFVQARLPHYLQPSGYCWLSQLPLNANGKLDRQRLPIPQLQTAERLIIAPQNADQAKLAELWAAILQREQVGINQNFFELGGHSLLATRLVSQIRQYWQLDLPIRSVFEAPTIEQLADVLDLLRWAQQANQAPAQAREQGAI